MGKKKDSCGKEPAKTGPGFANDQLGENTQGEASREYTKKGKGTGKK